MRSRSRTVLAVVVIAASALAAGVFAGMRITSPADAAARAEPPAASDVTVPVELRQLESTVVTRGDASYTGAVEVELEFTGLETSPVVTGQVPEVGDEVAAGDVILEVVGRPVIVLPGDIPGYRTLQPGMTGPDVAQLEKALADLGYDPGTVDDAYTNATGRAVTALFDEAGYDAPATAPEIRAELDAAEETARMAQDELANAEAVLRAAGQGPGEAEKIAAQNEVDRAERALDEARRSGDQDAVADATGQLELAEASQRDLLGGTDTAAEQTAVDTARERLAQAQQDRDAAAAAAGTPVPATEVVFVPGLPRRVDAVNVSRGDTVEEAVMSISGADLAVTANVDASARELLDEEMPALIGLPDGGEVPARITRIAEASGDEPGYDLTLVPEELDADDAATLRAANVRVTIPVESTEREVLAVPLAALTAGPDGSARVEVERPGDDGAEPTTELVDVEVGLTADGYAEVEPVDGGLDEGDLVVVGAGGAADDRDA